MFSPRADEALDYRRMARDDVAAITKLEYDPVQLSAFLGPIDQIVAEVQDGLAHGMIGIEEHGALIGFMVVHPDPRDRSCWWLAWFAIDRSHQGRGHGRVALAHGLGLLAHLDGCRRIRLLVAHGNAVARHLYDAAGFDDVGRDDEGWHIMEFVVPSPIPLLDPSGARRAAQIMPAKRTRRRLRLRPATGNNPARTLGSTRAPPGVRILLGRPSDAVFLRSGAHGQAAAPFGARTTTTGENSTRPAI